MAVVSWCVCRSPCYPRSCRSRYLSPFNATWFLEYICNGAGLSGPEMQAWCTAAHEAIDTQNAQAVDRIHKEWVLHLNRQFLMTHYIYFRMQYPEPFDLLYFTPSLYLLVNGADKSMMGGLDLNWKRFDAVSLNAKLVGLYGKADSEFGSKISGLKAALSVKYYF